MEREGLLDAVGPNEKCEIKRPLVIMRERMGGV